MLIEIVKYIYLVYFLYFTGLFHFLADHCEGGFVEDGGHGVTDLAHDDAGAAGLDVDAFVALAEAGFAGAGERGQGAFDGPNDGPDGDFFRRLGEDVAATFSFFAGDEAGAF